MLTWGAGFLLMFASPYLSETLAQFALAVGVMLMLVGLPFGVHFAIKQIGALLSYGHVDERRKRPPKGPN